jgi:hypothetical protein
MKQQFEVYIKKLTPQELGYRKGRLMTGGYFYISKSAVGNFFKELDKYVLNDDLRLDFNDPLEPDGIIQATYVYHNDKFAREARHIRNYQKGMDERLSIPKKLVVSTKNRNKMIRNSLLNPVEVIKQRENSGERVDMSNYRKY